VSENVTPYTTLLITNNGPVRTITLNRPERRNAMTPEMQDELIAAIDDAATSACRVIVFQGAGETFCSGLDLSVLQGLRAKTTDEHRADAERLVRLFQALYELPKPTIAAVRGAAIAGGAGLATICDFTLAVPQTKFGYTEVRIGFVPAVVSTFLTLQIGEKRSRDLLLTGRVFDATEGYRLGLVNEVVAPDDLPARVTALAAVLVENSPESLAATKRLMIAQQKPWLAAALANATEASVQSRQTTDFEEGVAAFLEKRKPRWSQDLE
jgi:methylglutaconyl-CoA hydratase